MRRANAQKLIRAGCRVTPGTDSYWAAAPEFTRSPKPPEQDHGTGTIMAIEGLVELGMTPSQAIVAGTRNGAAAARGLKDFGTIEPGKLADLILLTADPLADIGNLRKIGAVIKGGQVVDRARLPETRVLSAAPPAARPARRPSEHVTMREHRRVFWAAAWLAIVLLAIKAFYLGTPAAATPHAAWDYLRDLAAVSFVDALFAAVLWVTATAALLLAGDRPRVARMVAIVAMLCGAISSLYAIASVFFFGIFGGFLTYPLLALVGDLHMLRSSVAAQLSPSALSALAAAPLLYLALVEATLWTIAPGTGTRWRPRLVALALLAGWVIGGERWFTREWTTRRDRQVAANAEWVFVSSWWKRWPATARSAWPVPSAPAIWPISSRCPRRWSAARCHRRALPAWWRRGAPPTSS